tara:strand:+ start:7434 stop:8708 length:1275 start_codon:yes stop_codon:yes gene_type:complete
MPWHGEPIEMKKKQSTAMLGLGYDAANYHGSMKQPIFQTSTYEFPNAEAGKQFFAWATGKEEPPLNTQMGHIYSRLGSPNTALLEERLAHLDQIDEAAVFGSGMAAISATLLEFCRPGSVLLHTNPVYGGTHSFMVNYLEEFDIRCFQIQHQWSIEKVVANVQSTFPDRPVSGFFTESPANPTMDIYSIQKAKKICEAFRSEEQFVPVIVDNTYLGPVLSQQHKNGADLVVYSLTKNIAGHSDVIAGAVTGKTELISRIKKARTFIGGILGPMDSWLILRSLETYTIRIQAQEENTRKVAKFLVTHPSVEEIRYLGNITDWNPEQQVIFSKEYGGIGSMIALYIKGGEKEAFTVLNNIQVFKLGVSLGSTESLAEHPYSMTHAKVDDTLKEEINITESLIRLSIGLEDCNDLIHDLNTALNLIN